MAGTTSPSSSVDGRKEGSMPNTLGIEDADMLMKSVVLEVEKRISLERFTEPYDDHSPRRILE